MGHRLIVVATTDITKTFFFLAFVSILCFHNAFRRALAALTCASNMALRNKKTAMSMVVHATESEQQPHLVAGANIASSHSASITCNLRAHGKLKNVLVSS